MNVFKRIWNAVRGIESEALAKALDEAHFLRNEVQKAHAVLAQEVAKVERKAQAEIADLQTRLNDAEARVADLVAKGGNIIRDRTR